MCARPNQKVVHASAATPPQTPSQHLVAFHRPARFAQSATELVQWTSCKGNEQAADPMLANLHRTCFACGATRCPYTRSTPSFAAVASRSPPCEKPTKMTSCMPSSLTTSSTRGHSLSPHHLLIRATSASLGTFPTCTIPLPLPGSFHPGTATWPSGLTSHVQM